MWVSSKVACEIFGINNKALLQSTLRANKQGKKICQLKGIYLPFNYTTGIGAGGKVLQIWIDENDENLNIREMNMCDVKTSLPNNNKGETKNEPQRNNRDRFDGTWSSDTTTTKQNNNNKRNRLFGVSGECGAETKNGKMSLGQHRISGAGRIGEFTLNSDFDIQCETATKSGDSKNIVDCHTSFAMTGVPRYDGGRGEWVATLRSQ